MHRPNELLDVAQAVGLETKTIVRRKRNQRQADCGIEIARRRRKSRHQSDQVGKKNEQKKTPEQGNILAALFSHDPIGERDHDPDQQLQHIFHADARVGNHRIGASRKRAPGDKRH